MGGWPACPSTLPCTSSCKQEARSCVSLLEEEGMTGRVEENDDCENRKLEGLKRPECVVDIS